MSTTLTPYLTFGGNTREAYAFFEKALGAKIETMMRTFRDNGEVTVFDGPFAETREMLAGFYLLEAKDLNEAIQLAAGIPPAKYGSIEVRHCRLRPVLGL